MKNITSVINDELYKLVAAKLSTPAGHRKFMANIASFMNQKSKQLNDIAPYHNILFNATDVNKLFASIDMKESDVKNILSKCFFWNQDYRPKCAKEPYVQILACAFRFYIKNDDSKSAKLVAIYLCFSGKFYASIYSNYWRYPVKDTIMDYVINNMLSDKFDLRKEGTILKSVDKMCNTYLEKYRDDFKKDLDDDDYSKKIIQQLRDRLKSFLKNIFVLYKQAAEEKLYMNYETDSLDPDDFHITDSDSNKAARLTEAAVGVLTSQRVNMSFCNSAQDTKNSVSANDLKNILESIILVDPGNIPKIKRVINILICSFYGAYPDNKDTKSVDFIEYATKPKPNTQDPLLKEMKATVLGWLNQDATYRRRASTRPATANAYYRGILAYFAFLVASVTK